MTEAVARWYRWHWPLALISVLALLTCLFYALVFTFASPLYPGIAINNEWLVTYIDPCNSHPGWCRGNEKGLRALQIDDRLVAIGGLTYDLYRNDRRLVPFDGYGPGEVVAITFSRGSQKRTILWEMPVVTAQNRVNDLVILLFWLPFWLSGIVVFLFLRPRDMRWRMLVLSNYLTAVWVAAGIVSTYQAVASSLVLHAVTWLMVPVYLHLHLLLPMPLFRQRRCYLLVPLYSVAAVLAVLEFFQILPGSAYTLGLAIAILGSLGLLVRGLLDRSSPSARLAARFMLTGIVLAFGPGVVLWLLPRLLNAPAPRDTALVISTLAIPVMPLFYAYAAFKRYLGDLEFRANRLLGLYSFIVLHIAAFVLVYSIGSEWASRPESLLAFSVAISLVFALAGSPLLARFQRLIGRLAYGTGHDSDEILRVFANRLAAALDQEALADLLADELVPNLLIRQSALSLVDAGEVRLLYARGTTSGDIPDRLGQVEQLLQEAGRYRPPQDQPQEAFHWVRLLIPLKTRDRTVGIWLFGQRDPDDFYPQDDIMLLTAFGSQAAITLENARLHQEAQARATKLEEIVEERTKELREAGEELLRSEKLSLLGQVAGAMGHELRNPLGAIKNAVYYLNMVLEAPDPEVKDTLDILNLEASNCAKIVQDLLDFARSRPPVHVQIQVNDTVRGALSDIPVPEGVEVVTELDEGLPPILADAIQLNQVFGNIITNAFQAMPEGGRLLIRSRAAEGEGVAISFADTGVGIPKENLGRMFEPLFTTKARGIGLGLAAVRLLVERHGGKVEVESEPGRGSTFTVWLPVGGAASGVWREQDESDRSHRGA